MKKILTWPFCLRTGLATIGIMLWSGPAITQTTFTRPLPENETMRACGGPLLLTDKQLTLEQQRTAEAAYAACVRKRIKPNVSFPKTTPLPVSPIQETPEERRHRELLDALRSIHD